MELSSNDCKVRPLPMLNVDGRTVQSVTNDLSRALYGGELEPEWLVVANFSDWSAAKQPRFGLRPSAIWPSTNGGESRLVIDIDRGNSEGWLVTVAWLRWSGDDDTSGVWAWTPLVRAKTPSRTRAWATCAALSRMLEID